MGRFFQEYDVLLTSALARPPVVTRELQPQQVKVAGMKLLGRVNAAGLLEALAGIEALVAVDHPRCGTDSATPLAGWYIQSHHTQNAQKAGARAG